MGDAAEHGADEGASADAGNQYYLKTIYGELCGPWGARISYLRNTHGSNAIIARIRRHWVYEGTAYEDPPYEVRLEPNLYGGQEPTPKDVLLGCPIPGQTPQQFYFDWTSRWA